MLAFWLLIILATFCSGSESDDRSLDNLEILLKIAQNVLAEYEDQPSLENDLNTAVASMSLMWVAYDSLIDRFKKSDPAFASMVVIPLTKVLPVGWPKNVFWYSHDAWSKNDICELMRHINEISFVWDWRKFDTVEPEEKMRLEKRLILATSQIFKSKIIPWAKIRKEFPDLHMTNYKANEWCDRDVFLVRKVIAHYERDEKETARLRFLERKINIDAKLLEKYNFVFSTTYLSLDWSKVQVHGWPDEVLFYSSQMWTESELEILESRINYISFKKLTFLPSIKYYEFRKLTSGFWDSFGTGNTPITRYEIMQLYPGLHLTCSNSKTWNAADYNQLKRFINLEKPTSILKKRKLEEFA